MKASTIYLLLAAVSLVLMLFFPVFVALIGDVYIEIYLHGDYIVQELKSFWGRTYPYAYIHVILCIYTIALFFMRKNIRVQSGMIRLNYILHMVYILMIYFEMKPEGKDILVGYRGFYFPLISMAFLFLANRSIKQEIKIQELLNSIRNKK